MSRRLRGLLIAASALLVLAAAGAGGVWHFARIYLSSPGPLRQNAVVDLPRGGGVSANAARLAGAGAIDHSLAFASPARSLHQDRALKAGEYELAPGMSPEAIIALLESGKVLLHPVQVPEGLTVREIYALLQASEVLTGDLPPLPPEGNLMPSTYLVPRGEPRAKLVERMRV